MSRLTEDAVAEALRDHAVSVAPPLRHDPDRVLTIGRRRRTRRAVAGSLAGLAGVAVLAVGVAEAVTPHTHVLGFAAPVEQVPPEPETGDDLVIAPDPVSAPDGVTAPDPEDLIERLGDALWDPERFPWDVPVDVVTDSARFVGGVPSGDAYAAVDAAGDICLVIVYPLVDADWIAESSCVAPSTFRDDGVTLGIGDTYGPVRAWLVPDSFGTPPAGWEAAGENLWVTEPEYPVNDLGLTYGPMIGYSAETMPDLGLVTADDGVTEGYVYLADLDGPTPTSPEEALEWQADGRYANRVLPVYESDGSTQVGTFTIGG